MKSFPSSIRSCLILVTFFMSSSLVVFAEESAQENYEMDYSDDGGYQSEFSDSAAPGGTSGNSTPASTNNTNATAAAPTGTSAGESSDSLNCPPGVPCQEDYDCGTTYCPGDRDVDTIDELFRLDHCKIFTCIDGRTNQFYSTCKIVFKEACEKEFKKPPHTSSPGEPFEEQDLLFDKLDDPVPFSPGCGHISATKRLICKKRPCKGSSLTGTCLSDRQEALDSAINEVFNSNNTLNPLFGSGVSANLAVPEDEILDKCFSIIKHIRWCEDKFNCQHFAWFTKKCLEQNGVPVHTISLFCKDCENKCYAKGKVGHVIVAWYNDATNECCLAEPQDPGHTPRFCVVTPGAASCPTAQQIKDANKSYCDGSWFGDPERKKGCKPDGAGVDDHPPDFPCESQYKQCLLGCKIVKDPLETLPPDLKNCIERVMQREGDVERACRWCCNYSLPRPPDCLRYCDNLQL